MFHLLLSVEQTFEMPAVWDAVTPSWRRRPPPIKNQSHPPRSKYWYYKMLTPIESINEIGNFYDYPIRNLLNRGILYCGPLYSWTQCNTVQRTADTWGCGTHLIYVLVIAGKAAQSLINIHILWHIASVYTFVVHLCLCWTPVCIYEWVGKLMIRFALIFTLTLCVEFSS